MIHFTFFGSSDFSIYVLEELKKHDFLPALIITTPDKPKGRGLALTPTPVKIWAQKNNITVLDSTKLDAVFIEQFKKYSVESLKISDWPLFIVASYGKIIPENIINLPRHKTINVHPSLLPKYRGAAPIQNTILDDTKETGVTIIRLDKEMDHGPIVTVEKTYFDDWPVYEKVEEKLGTTGGKLLARIMPDWISGKIKEVEQNHSQATFTKKITKEDGLIDAADLEADAPPEKARAVFCKIQAYYSWPGTYFFLEKKEKTGIKNVSPTTIDSKSKKIRVKITSAVWKEGQGTEKSKLMIEKVIPEGKKEMLYNDFLKGFK